MAEILATMVVGPLLSMVKDKASSILLDEYKVMEGMEEQHKILKRKLPAIMDVIADAEKQASEHREGAKAWLEEVRKVAYKGNDIFDEFKYEALRRKAKKEGHYRKLGMDVIKLFPTHNRIVFRYRMGNKLRFILQEMEVLIAEMNAFRFKFKPQQQHFMKWRQTDSNIIDPMKITSESRKEEKQLVVDTLLDQGSNVDLTVLPIFGMGGLGKTTLAQLVYNDPKIQEHFLLLLWVCVSDNFDVNFLEKRIVEEAAQHKKSDSQSLREVLSGKRYLLVLDDVWNRDTSKWERLKSSLQHGSMGSCVLTTTRDKAIAELMGTIKAHKLDVLDKNFIEKIIKIKAFGSEQGSATELVNMVGAMADKCAGSPLAATALGSMLHNMPSEMEWKTVLSRSTICDDETGILPILKLSYNDLPSQMRQCFSFCAVFPKDYEIDRDTLIQLWMANGFITEEIRGNQIFTELLSRSFFQDKEEITFSKSNLIHQYCSRIIFKIHDLMHDVAQSAMGKDCATISTEPSKSEDFPYSVRHLFVPSGNPGTTVNGFLEKSFGTLQTLLHTDFRELQYLSKYNSIRALKIKEYSSLKPKCMRHLRYLDLSNSDIEALPEDISILYHLQTLNLSNCLYLAQLPKEMKYMTSLRHLYTHGCRWLTMMPIDLRCLASLRTLTRFVAGSADSSCSSLGELGKLDLGDQLEICQLENVTETEAQKAKLGDKKRLTELTLIWTDPNREPQDDHKVLECLEPHDGIKALKIDSYGGNTCPTWMNTLPHMVELVLSDCEKIERLPPLWQLPALQVLCISNMKNLRCFCDGADRPFTFKKLKELRFYEMENFEAWWDINKMQGQDDPVIFPEIELLLIQQCQRLTALPGARTMVSPDRAVDIVWPSSFPKLKKLELVDLPVFQRWEAVEGTQGVMTFPLLEKLVIRKCRNLTALPRAPMITESSDGMVDIVSPSAFPKLKELDLGNLPVFQRWEAVEGDHGEQVTTFPSLENLFIEDCPNLTTLPEASKLSVLKIYGGSQHLCLHATKYITWVSRLNLSASEREATLPSDHNLIKLVDHKEKSSVRVLSLSRCDFFLAPVIAPVLWSRLVQLEDLTIVDLDALEDWPENVFRCLVSLKTLRFERCKSLTGRTQQEEASSEQSTATSSTVLPPRLKVLSLKRCDSLEEVPTLPTFLRELYIEECDKLESIIVRKQQDTRLGGVRDGVEIRQEKSAPLRQGSCSLSPSVTLEELWITGCNNLQSLSVQLDCTGLSIWRCRSLNSLDIRRQEKSAPIHQGSCSEATDVPHLSSSSLSPSRPLKLIIDSCNSLKSLQHLPSLEILSLRWCDSLESIPDVPQVYSSLRRLEIHSCALLKVFPPFLMQRRLSNKNEETRLDEDHLPSLETLILIECNLESLTDVPQVYSSLTDLSIESCPHLKVLPPCLKQRLNDIEYTDLDARYTGPKLSRPSTWKYAISGHCLAIRGHGDRQHHTGPQEHGSAPVAHGDDTASQNRVQNPAAPAGAQAAAQMMVQSEEANRGSNEQEELMELDFKPKAAGARRADGDGLEDVPAPKADAMALAIPKAELHRSTRQADSVQMEQAEKLKAGCNLDGPYPKVESPQKEPLLAYNVQDEDTQVHSRIEDEDASDQRNEEMLQPRDEEGEAASFEGNGQQSTNVVPKELKEPKNAKKSTNREGMMDRHHEMSTRQAEQEVELLAKETEATKSTDYSIKRCISVMNSMDVTVEEKAKAYSFFKNKDNREVFLCACEGDPESALLWLRNEMVKYLYH